MASVGETRSDRSCGLPVAVRARRAVLLSDDGVRIDAAYHPYRPAGNPPGRPPNSRSASLAVVVAHGFTGSLERPAVRRAAAALASYASVVTFSFRRRPAGESYESNPASGTPGTPPVRP